MSRKNSAALPAMSEDDWLGLLADAGQTAAADDDAFAEAEAAEAEMFFAEAPAQCSNEPLGEGSAEPPDEASFAAATQAKPEKLEKAEAAEAPGVLESSSEASEDSNAADSAAALPTAEREVEAGFDVKTAPLTTPTLLEASAGTGKTFSIKHLVLRIVAELGIPIEEVLVVSFTRAATAELKQRIQQHLSEMHGLLAGSLSPEDAEPLLLEQLALWDQAAVAGDKGLERDALCRKLKQALAGFDNASILTIHGFCQKMLREHAFSAASSLEEADAGDASAIFEEVVEDFLRRELDAHPGEPGVAQCLAAGEDWTSKLEKLCGTPEKLVPRSVVDKDGCDLNLPAEAPKRGKKAAPPPEEAAGADGQFDEREYLRGMLSRFAAVCPAQAAKKKREAGIVTFDDFLVQMWRRLDEDASGGFAAAIRRACRAVLIDEFQDTDPLQFAIFERLFISTPLSEEEKTQPRALFFVGDPKQAIYRFRSADLNTYLRAKRLIGRIGRIDSLRTNFRSTPGLVDAFNAFFGLAKGTALGPFLRPDLPYEAVCAAPGKTGLYRRVSADGVEPMTPLEIWGCWGSEMYANAELARAAAASAVAEDIAKLLDESAKHTALAEASDGRAVIGVFPVEKNGAAADVPLGCVRPADIAILVRARSDADAVRAALAKHNIRARMREQKDVMDTPEARELYLVLTAVNSPGDERALRAARATRFIGDTLSMISSDDESRRIEIRAVFEESAKNWRRTGVAAAFQGLMSRFDVAGRLLKLENGDRTVANYNHLIEVLHEAGRTQTTPSGLLTWFDREIAASMASGAQVDEGRRLRLESDDNVVTIETIHSSKGLQYPIVYLPFAQALRGLGQKSAAILDYPAGPSGGMRLRLSHERASLSAASKLEEAEEMARLAYVAMTRAAKRLVIVCPYTSQNAKNPGKSHWMVGENAVMRILAGTAGRVDFDEAKALAAALHAPILKPEEFSRIGPDGRPAPIALRELAPLETGEADALTQVRLRDRPALSVAPARPRHAAWQTSSFSKLARTLEDQPAAVRPFYGARRREVLGEPDILAFPAGPQPGTCLHAIFEHADFARHAAGSIEGEAAREALAKAMVERFLAIADEAKKANAVKGAAKMLFDVLNAEILPGRRLRDVPPEQRFAEMEFLVHMHAALTPELLAQALALLDPKYAVPAFSHEKLTGFMTGFVDLAMAVDGRYWVVDWKSNAIASTPEGFTQEAMDREMTRHHYRLQYLIYLVALRRLLKARLGPHFRPDMVGGAIYVFVRGVRAGQTTVSNPQGIVRDEVKPEVLEMLDEIFSRGVPAKLMRRALAD